MAVVLDTPCVSNASGVDRWGNVNCGGTSSKSPKGYGNYSVHSIYKQPTGARLALGALTTVYNLTSNGGFFSGPVPHGAPRLSPSTGEISVVFGSYGCGFELRNNGSSGHGFEVLNGSAWVAAAIASSHGDGDDEGRSQTAVGPTTVVTLAGHWGSTASHLRYLWHSTPCALFDCPLYSDGSSYKLPASPFFLAIER